MKIKIMAAGFLAVAMFASMALTPAWAEELTDSVVTNDLTDTVSDEPSDTDVLDEDENSNRLVLNSPVVYRSRICLERCVVL